MIYVLRAHIVRPIAGGLLSKSEDDARVASDVHVFYEESVSLQSTGRRLIQSNDSVDEKVDEVQVESLASEFQYGVEHLYPREIPEQEGVVSGVRDGDAVVDLPR